MDCQVVGEELREIMLIDLLAQGVGGCYQRQDRLSGAVGFDFLTSASSKQAVFIR
jgi:hypothetical protein